MFNEKWSKFTATFRGLPRPYSEVPEIQRIMLNFKGSKISEKVPIPWQSLSCFDNNGFLAVIKEHEEEVIEKGTCAYCGLGFEEDEKSIMWVNYPEKNPEELKDRVWSDHFPFHISCMKETRIFCPHMKNTKDEEFKTGTYKDLLQEITNLLNLQLQGMLQPKFLFLHPIDNCGLRQGVEQGVSKL